MLRLFFTHITGKVYELFSKENCVLVTVIDSTNCYFIFAMYLSFIITGSLDHVSAGDSSAFLNRAKLGQPSTFPVKRSLSPLPPSVDDIDETVAHSCDVDVDLTYTQLVTRSVEACKVKMQLHYLLRR